MRLYPLLTLRLSSSLTLTSTFLSSFETFHKPKDLVPRPCEDFRKNCRGNFPLVQLLTKLNSYNVPVFSKNGERPTYYPGYHQTDITRIKA